MNNQQIASRKQNLDSLFARLSTVTDPEMQSHWARYLCVLVSGFIEDSVRILLTEYVKGKANKKISDYVMSQLSSFTNANTEKILTLTGKFSKDWELALRAEVDDELKSAIDSTVARRHEIAHGKNSSITFHTIRNYYGRVVKAIEMIERYCT